MKVKAKSRPITPRRYIELLKRHLNDTGLMTSFASPAVTPEEFARAKFLASQVLTELTKSDGDRIRALTCVALYQMSVAGVVQWMEAELLVRPKPEAPPIGPTKHGGKK